MMAIVVSILTMKFTKAALMLSLDRDARSLPSLTTTFISSMSSSSGSYSVYDGLLMTVSGSLRVTID